MCPQEPLCATGQAAAAGDEDSAHVQVFLSLIGITSILTAFHFSDVQLSIATLTQWLGMEL